MVSRNQDFINKYSKGKSKEYIMVKKGTSSNKEVIVKKKRHSSKRIKKNVVIKGGTVIINGAGYSVAPSQQVAFIKKQTGGYGESAKNAILLANRIENTRRAKEKQKQEALLEAQEKYLANLKNNSNNNSNSAEINRIKLSIRNRQNRIANNEYINFKSDVASGKLVGMTGSGLTPSEEAKRNFLIKTGVLREVSDRSDPFGTVDPLATSFFINTLPTNKEKIGFINYIKGTRFNTARSNTSINNLYSLDKLRNRLVNNVKSLKKNGYSGNSKEVIRNILTSKKSLRDKLIQLQFIPAHYTKRQIDIILLGIAGGTIKFTEKAKRGTGKVINLLKEVDRKRADSVVKTNIEIDKAKIALRKSERAMNNDKKNAEKRRLYFINVKKYNGLIVRSMMLAGGGQIKNEALGIIYLGQIAGALSTKKGRGALWANKSNILPNAQKSIIEFGQLIKARPEQAGAIITVILMSMGIGLESIIIRKGSRIILKPVKKLVGIIDDFNPRVVKIMNGVIDLSGVSRKKVGRFYEGLRIGVGGVKEGAESLSKAGKRAGKRVTAVTAQSKKLVGAIKRTNVIKKPLPGGMEKLISVKLRKQLKRFDEGRLARREILQLNKDLARETKILFKGKGQIEGIDLIERGTFFDVNSLRPSRLNINNNNMRGSLKDLLTGKASLFKFKSKPQILLLDAYMDVLPKTKKYISLKRKLNNSIKAGVDPRLTQTERALLSVWEMTPTGKLKMYGSTTFKGGMEREVLLSAKETIRYVKTIGKLKIGNSKIPIVVIEIVKDKPSLSILMSMGDLIRKENNLQKILSNLFKKSKKGLTKLEQKKARDSILELKKLAIKKAKLVKRAKSKKLKRFLKDYRRTNQKIYLTNDRITTFMSRLSRVGRVTAKRTVRKTAARKTVVRTTARRITNKKTGRKKGVTRKNTNRKRTNRPLTKRTKAKGTRVTPSKRKVKKIVHANNDKYGYRTLKKAIQVYYIIIKKKGKFIKLNRYPLDITTAKDVLAWKIDNTYVRSAWFKPMGKSKKIVTTPKNIKGYFPKVKSKLRPYKIRMGKNKQILRGYIEKNKYALDSKGEHIKKRKPIKKKRTKNRKK